jgi:hypothetical protein
MTVTFILLLLELPNKTRRSIIEASGAGVKQRLQYCTFSGISLGSVQDKEIKKSGEIRRSFFSFA